MHSQATKLTQIKQEKRQKSVCTKYNTITANIF